MFNRIISIILFFLVTTFCCSQNKNAEYYNNLGNSKFDSSDFKGAIRDYNKAIEINPQYADAYFNRGVVKYILKDTNGACLDWSKAGELGHMEAYDLIKKYCK